MADFYRLLGISRRADGATIKATYYHLAKQYHPDTNAGAEASERFREIQSAYETLGNPIARAEYDLEQAGERSRARKSFLVGALAGVSTLVLLGSLLPALVNVPTARTNYSRAHETEIAKATKIDTHSDAQATSAVSGKDMSCQDV